MNGFICINKPANMSSSDVVMNVRHILGEKKVGHTGTLDPNACGLLVVALGKATRFIEYTDAFHKSYRCKGILGLATDTHDVWGSPVFDIRKNLKLPSEEELEKALYSMRGNFSQIPSKYCALKIDGKRAYELARSGQDVEIKSREIGLFNLSLLDYQQNEFLFDVTCSSGTYVRTLCDALGAFLNCGASMNFLLRTSCSSFNLEDAISLEELLSMDETQRQKAIFPIDHVLSKMPKARLKKERVNAFLNGLEFSDTTCEFQKEQPIPGRLVSVYDGDKLLGTALCLMQNKRLIFRAEKVLK